MNGERKWCSETERFAFGRAVDAAGSCRNQLGLDCVCCVFRPTEVTNGRPRGAITGKRRKKARRNSGDNAANSPLVTARCSGPARSPLTLFKGCFLRFLLCSFFCASLNERSADSNAMYGNGVNGWQNADFLEAAPVCHEPSEISLPVQNKNLNIFFCMQDLCSYAVTTDLNYQSMVHQTVLATSIDP